MTPLENDYYEVRDIIEQRIKCDIVGHSPSGCARCRALAALDRLNWFVLQLEGREKK